MFCKFIRALMLLTLLLAASHTANAQHGGPPPAPEAIEVPTKGVSLPMLDFGGRTVVEVRINGKGPYRFILGSAATLTVIDSSLNKELALPEAEGVQAAPVGGQTPVIVTIQELRLGEAAVRGFMGAVISMSGFLSGPGAPRGILSASVFQGYLVTYDYPKKRVFLEKGKLAPADAQSIFDYSESRPTVPVKIAGRETRVGLDTGSAFGLTLPTRFIAQLPLASPPKDAGKIRTSAGEFAVSAAPLTGEVQLGRHKLAVAEVNFSDVRVGGNASPGQLGATALRNFVVTLDSWNHRIRLSQ